MAWGVKEEEFMGAPGGPGQETGPSGGRLI